MKRIVFLYSELAEYFLACLRAVTNPEIEIHVIHWPVNPEAPFLLDKPAHIQFYDRSILNASELKDVVQKIAPDVLLCSGWMDRDYLSICSIFRKKIPVVLLLDNPWTGSWKQKVASLFGPYTLKRRFSHAWVPGEAQKKFAIQLGFPANRIPTGFYCADGPLFTRWFNAIRPVKLNAMPHRFLYIGRYVPHKGIEDLWLAFSRFADTNDQWELWCAGTGESWEQRMIHPRIRHFGFQQPSELLELVRQTSVFVLPSHKEPWGVVVHEMVLAGMPLLCSRAVGAIDFFLEENRNGYTFESGDTNALQQIMQTMAALNDATLLEMGDRSHALGLAIDQVQWQRTLVGFIDQASG